jgi:hypothetical protein
MMGECRAPGVQHGGDADFGAEMFGIGCDCQHTHRVAIANSRLISGFYTKEFFEQLKRILKSNGVVAMSTLGLSWHTTESNFPYIYRNIDPAVSEPFRRSVFFLSREPLSQRFQSSYTRINVSNPERLLYTDHRIYGLTWKSISAQIGQYFRKLWKK